MKKIKIDEFVLRNMVACIDCDCCPIQEECDEAHGEETTHKQCIDFWIEKSEEK